LNDRKEVDVHEMEKIAFDPALVTDDRPIVALSQILTGFNWGQASFSGSSAAVLGFTGCHALCSD